MDCRDGVQIKACKTIIAAETLHVGNPNKADDLHPEFFQVERVAARLLDVHGRDVVFLGIRQYWSVAGAVFL